MSTTRIPFDEWGAIDQHAAQRMARDPELKPLHYRVMFAALGWANLIGHAEFAPGGLAMVLQSNDPRTGEMSMPNRQQIANVIRKAKSMDLLGQESSFRCLVAPDWWEKAGGTGGRTCAHHGIGRKRRRRSVAPTAKRHTRSVTPTQEKCQADPVTSNNVTALYDSDLPPDPAAPRRSA